MPCQVKRKKLFRPSSYDQVEDSSALVLGNFLSFIEKLLFQSPLLTRPTRLNDWAKFFADIGCIILGDKKMSGNFIHSDNHKQSRFDSGKIRFLMKKLSFL